MAICNKHNTQSVRQRIAGLLQGVKCSSCIIALIGSGLLAFGLYNVHSVSGVTEGGILGLTLLLDHWFHISPSVSGFVLNLACYFMGWKLLGRLFLIYSFVSAAGFSFFYKICEQFDPLFPQLADLPLLAAILGALFVGVSVGLCVRIGGAPGGDDALAMSLSSLTHLDITWIYLMSDLIVLVLSLSYIPLHRIIYSIFTVILSGQIIGLMQRLPGRDVPE